MRERERLLRHLLDCLSGNVRNPPDWAPLLRLASETLMIGSLAETVLANELERELPPNVRDFLVDIRSRARQRNEQLTCQLLELLPAFNAIGVEPILMKGMARLLGSPNEQGRILSDVDLVVPAQRREECIHALTNLGYQIVKPDRGHPAPVEFGRSRDVGMIDLHTAVGRHYLEFAFDGISPHCQRVDLASGQALLPSPTCQLMLNIVHDQINDVDYWRGLIDVRHLADIPRLASEGVDWGALASFFPPGCCRNALDAQLLTARSLLGVNIPKEYCGRTWARFQLLRRQWQARWPFLMPFLTLLTAMVDPAPKQRSSGANQLPPLWRRMGRNLKRYLRPVNCGKLSS